MTDKQERPPAVFSHFFKNFVPLEAKITTGHLLLCFRDRVQKRSLSRGLGVVKDVRLGFPAAACRIFRDRFFFILSDTFDKEIVVDIEREFFYVLKDTPGEPGEVSLARVGGADKIRPSSRQRGGERRRLEMGGDAFFAVFNGPVISTWVSISEDLSAKKRVVRLEGSSFDSTLVDSCVTGWLSSANLVRRPDGVFRLLIYTDGSLRGSYTLEKGIEYFKVASIGDLILVFSKRRIELYTSEGRASATPNFPFDICDPRVARYGPNGLVVSSTSIPRKLLLLRITKGRIVGGIQSLPGSHRSGDVYGDHKSRRIFMASRSGGMVVLQLAQKKSGLPREGTDKAKKPHLEIVFEIPSVPEAIDSVYLRGKREILLLGATTVTSVFGTMDLEVVETQGDTIQRGAVGGPVGRHSLYYETSNYRLICEWSGLLHISPGTEVRLDSPAHQALMLFPGTFLLVTLSSHLLVVDSRGNFKKEITDLAHLGFLEIHPVPSGCFTEYAGFEGAVVLSMTEDNRVIGAFVMYSAEKDEAVVKALDRIEPNDFGQVSKFSVARPTDSMGVEIVVETNRGSRRTYRVRDLDSVANKTYLLPDSRRGVRICSTAAGSVVLVNRSKHGVFLSILSERYSIKKETKLDDDFCDVLCLGEYIVLGMRCNNMDKSVSGCVDVYRVSDLARIQRINYRSPVTRLAAISGGSVLAAAGPWLVTLSHDGGTYSETFRYYGHNRALDIWAGDDGKTVAVFDILSGLLVKQKDADGSVIELYRSLTTESEMVGCVLGAKRVLTVSNKEGAFQIFDVRTKKREKFQILNQIAVKLLYIKGSLYLVTRTSNIYELKVPAEWEE